MVTVRTVFVGTDDGLYTFEEKEHRKLLDGSIGALTAESDSIWAIVQDKLMFNATTGADWREVTKVPTGQAGGATCLLATSAGLLLGTAGAHLFRFADANADAKWERVESFESVEGRDEWYTPWGGPPDTRSLSQDGQRHIYVNVHVGGIPKSSDDGRTWQPTIDIDSDVHQVLALPSPPGTPHRVLAATARGFGISEDGGTTWHFDTRGLDGTYCRAVAVSDNMVFVTASTGPGGHRAALYRRAIDGDARHARDADAHFERCRVGLPEWFSGNIDTYCLSASRKVVAFGTDTGAVFASWDQGETWQDIATDLAPVRCVLVP